MHRFSKAWLEACGTLGITLLERNDTDYTAEAERGGRKVGIGGMKEAECLVTGLSSGTVTQTFFSGLTSSP